MHIHLQRVVSQLGGGVNGGGVGGQKFKSEKAHVNTHTHMHIHLQRVVGQIKISPVWPRGNWGKGLGGQKFKSQKKHMSDVLEMGVPAMWPPYVEGNKGVGMQWEQQGFDQ